MIKEILVHIFKGKIFWILSVFIFLEAALVAYEIFVLASVGTSEKSVRALAQIALVYLLVEIFRLIVSGSISIIQEMWHVDFLKRLLDFGAGNVTNRPDIYGNKNLENERPTAALSSGYLITKNILTFITTTARNGLQLSLMIGAFCILFSFKLLVPLGFSLTISILITRIFNSRLGIISEKTETMRIQVASVYGAVWHNLVLGNTDWVQEWKRKFDLTYRNFRSSNTKQCFADLGFALSHVLISYVAIIASIIYLIENQGAASAYFLGFIAALPKLIQLLRLQTELAQYITGYSFLQGQCRTLWDTISKPDLSELASRISIGRISIHDSNGDPVVLDNILEELRVRQNASNRYSIKGPNGSGKTSLLLEMKQRMGAKAMILPAASSEMTKENQELSTGQSHVKSLEIALTASLEPIILLDEWDAHLDAKNISEIEKLIESAIFKGKTIIETRYRLAQAY